MRSRGYDPRMSPFSLLISESDLLFQMLKLHSWIIPRGQNGILFSSKGEERSSRKVIRTTWSTQPPSVPPVLQIFDPGRCCMWLKAHSSWVCWCLGVGYFIHGPPYVSDGHRVIFVSCECNEISSLYFDCSHSREVDIEDSVSSFSSFSLCLKFPFVMKGRGIFDETKTSSLLWLNNAGHERPNLILCSLFVFLTQFFVCCKEKFSFP